jgi:hypothetical protein
VLGVLVQPYFQAYQTTGAWVWNGFANRTVFSLIAGLVILPAVYRRSFDPETPGVVQFGAIVVAGMGWQSLLPAALKAGQAIVQR